MISARGGRVERRGRLVENHHFGMGDHGAPRRRCWAHADLARIALKQALGEAGQRRGLAYLLPRGRRATFGARSGSSICSGAGVDQATRRFLEDEPQHAAHRSARHRRGAYILAAIDDAAAGQVVGQAQRPIVVLPGRIRRPAPASRPCRARRSPFTARTTDFEPAIGKTGRVRRSRRRHDRSPGK